MAAAHAPGRVQRCTQPLRYGGAVCNAQTSPALRELRGGLPMWPMFPAGLPSVGRRGLANSKIALLAASPWPLQCGRRWRRRRSTSCTRTPLWGPTPMKAPRAPSEPTGGHQGLALQAWARALSCACPGRHPGGQQPSPNGIWCPCHPGVPRPPAPRSEKKRHMRNRGEHITGGWCYIRRLIRSQQASLIAKLIPWLHHPAAPRPAPCRAGGLKEDRNPDVIRD